MRRMAVFALLASAALLETGALPAAGAPVTPTPTPRPRLSGGFGRPRSTPVPASTSEGGQALSDVVRAAHETRGAPGPAERSGVVIDNKNLVKNPDKGRVTTGAFLPTKAPTAVPKASAPGGPGSEPATPSAGAAADGEAEWREIARKDRKRVDDARAKVAELSAAAKKLENDFYAWDDGQYRDRVIKPSWDRTLSQLEDAKHELEDAEKELADLPEKARRAGALPGWIRE